MINKAKLIRRGNIEIAEWTGERRVGCSFEMAGRTYTMKQGETEAFSVNM